ncbi:MAG: hypothetical protein ACREPY_11720 [Rhodanobacteraceae bacterium]
MAAWAFSLQMFLRHSNVYSSFQGRFRLHWKRNPESAFEDIRDEEQIPGSIAEQPTIAPE